MDANWYYVSNVVIFTNSINYANVFDVVSYAAVYEVDYVFGKISMDVVADEKDCHVNVNDIDNYHIVYKDQDLVSYLLDNMLFTVYYKDRSFNYFTL